mmetsp:Transcript_5427/g.13641  ORF Transcript_5427/g.13641 Transcript_5427/m.13641 type:complete len:80 (+) Transcript_5427:263-502(+)
MKIFPVRRIGKKDSYQVSFLYSKYDETTNLSPQILTFSVDSGSDNIASISDHICSSVQSVLPSEMGTPPVAVATPKSPI